MPGIPYSAVSASIILHARVAVIMRWVGNMHCQSIDRQYPRIPNIAGMRRVYDR